MTRDEYLKIRNNPAQDTMPVLYFFYTINVSIKTSYEHFKYSLSLWMEYPYTPNIGRINYIAFLNLDKYFLVN
jgi:hypothetical protein